MDTFSLDPGRLSHLRLACGLNQQSLASLFGVGVATVSRWERGEKRPRGLPARLYEALDALDRDGRDLRPVGCHATNGPTIAGVAWILVEYLENLPQRTNTTR